MQGTEKQGHSQETSHMQQDETHLWAAGAWTRPGEPHPIYVVQLNPLPHTLTLWSGAQSMGSYRPQDSQTCGHPQKRQLQRKRGTTTASHVSPQPLLTATCHQEQGKLLRSQVQPFFQRSPRSDFYVKAFKKRIEEATLGLPWGSRG